MEVPLPSVFIISFMARAPPRLEEPSTTGIRNPRKIAMDSCPSLEGETSTAALNPRRERTAGKLLPCQKTPRAPCWVKISTAPGSSEVNFTRQVDEISQ
jgi:hypothetical protein